MLKVLTTMFLGAVFLAANAQAVESIMVRGQVKAFHESPKGDVDGVTLAGGEELHFPPHVGKQVQAVVEMGDEVRATAEMHVTPKGDEHLRAEQITNVKSGKTIECDAPPPEKKAKPEPKPPVANKPRAEMPKGEPAREPPHEQILAELRELQILAGGAAPTKYDAAVERREGPPHERIMAELRLLRAQLERKGGDKR